MQTLDPQTGEVTERSIKAVAKKITLAMADMEAYAAKDGYNTFHKYDFTSISQYMAHIRPALVKHGLIIVPSLISHTDYEDSTTDVLMEYTIIDSDTGEYLKQRIVGRGQDASSNGKRLDKGPYKAYSGAFKYFLAETFMIASGDDPDDSGPKQPARTQTDPKPIPPKADGKDRPTGNATQLPKPASISVTVTNPPYRFPSTAAQKFFERVQQATDNHYENGEALEKTLGGWFNFGNAELWNERLSYACDMARSHPEPVEGQPAAKGVE